MSARLARLAARARRRAGLGFTPDGWPLSKEAAPAVNPFGAVPLHERRKVTETLSDGTVRVTYTDTLEELSSPAAQNSPRMPGKGPSVAKTENWVPEGQKAEKRSEGHFSGKSAEVAQIPAQRNLYSRFPMPGHEEIRDRI